MDRTQKTFGHAIYLNKLDVIEQTIADGSITNYNHEEFPDTYLFAVMNKLNELGPTSRMLPRYVKIVKTLIAANAESFIVDSGLGWTHLHTAAMSGWTRVAKFLLTSKLGNINQEDTIGRSPILVAVDHEKEDMVQFLLLEGSKVVFKFFEKDQLMHYFANRPFLGINGAKAFKKLLTSVDDPVDRQRLTGLLLIRAMMNKDRLLTNHVMAHNPNILVKDVLGYTALHFAVSNGSWDLTQELVSRGVDINARTKDDAPYPGMTALHISCLKNEERALKQLIANGADLDIRDVDGNTALMLACGKGYPELVKILLLAGASVATTDDSPLLHAVASNSRLDLAQVLLDAGVSSNTMDENGWTPLFAVKSRAMVKLLIDYGANPNWIDHAGWTPLHIACRLLNLDTVVALIEFGGVDINAATTNRLRPGMIPLHLVASNKEGASIVRKLVALGADIFRADRNGVTPLSLANQKGGQEASKLLSLAGAEQN